MESKEYTKRKGGVEISLLAYHEDDVLDSVCCGAITIDGNTVSASINLDKHGLHHTYEGDKKATVDSLLSSIGKSLASDFNLTFEPMPEVESVEHQESEG